MKTKTLLAAGMILTVSLVGESRAQAFGWFENRPLFHAELSPHGTWFSFGSHGWVWRPTVTLTVPDWRPYCHGGDWTLSDGAWCWRSSYPWGHIPFHYGRWLLTDEFGWVWVPGAEWAPAWVSWRYDGAYWGWAPRPPELHPHLRSSDQGPCSAGTTFSLGFDLGLTDLHFVFMNRDRFHRRPVETHAVPRHETPRVYGRTAPCPRAPEPPPVAQTPPVRYEPPAAPFSVPSRRTTRVQRVVSSAPSVSSRPSIVSRPLTAPSTATAGSAPTRSSSPPPSTPTPSHSAPSQNHGSRSGRVQAVLSHR
jgi:hypothetical protein